VTDLALFSSPQKIPRIYDARDYLWRRKRDSPLPIDSVDLYAY